MDTFVAQATPVGTSAIALIRVNGPLVLQFVKLLAKNPKNGVTARKAYVSDYPSKSGEIIDSVLWTFFESGASYTGDPILEIMPHGNPLICKKIISDLCERGCRLAEPGEFTQRAFINKKLKLSQVEGVLEVIHAQSDRALFQARKQLSGESGKLIKGIVHELTAIRADIEAHIDFPEDELPEEDVFQNREQLVGLIEKLTAFESTAQTKEAIQNGINTLIVGSPNAGKSSLLNYIVGHSRALVSEVSGTTRDYIIERAYMGDYLLNLYDTAGITNAPSNEIESQGIERTIELFDQTDFFIIVVDSCTEVPVLPESLHDRINRQNTIVVENKIDLPENQPKSQFLNEFEHIRLSTLERSYFVNLQSILQQKLKEAYESDANVDTMFNHRQAAFIRNANFELKQALESIDNNTGSEIVAFHLIRASEELDKINEHIDNEEVLDQLFQRFCIGK